MRRRNPASTMIAVIAAYAVALQTLLALLLVPIPVAQAEAWSAHCLATTPAQQPAPHLPPCCLGPGLCSAMAASPAPAPQGLVHILAPVSLIAFELPPEPARFGGIVLTRHRPRAPPAVA